MRLRYGHELRAAVRLRRGRAPRQLHPRRGGLHLAQPSLSRQISALEQDLGSELFHRARSGSTLTSAGELLLPLARRMLADAESVRRELAELAGLERGRVRFGATPTLCISLVAEVLHAFHAAHPAIELHLAEDGSRSLFDRLARVSSTSRWSRPRRRRPWAPSP